MYVKYLLNITTMYINILNIYLEYAILKKIHIRVEGDRETQRTIKSSGDSWEEAVNAGTPITGRTQA